MLEGFNGDRIGGISQREQRVLDRLVLVLTSSGSQVEVMAQEGKDVVRIFNPWEGFVPLVGTVHGEARSLLLGERDRGLHNDVEQIVALLGDVVLGEGSDELHGLQSAVDFVGGGSGVPEGLGELLVDPRDLRFDFVAVTSRLSVVRRQCKIANSSPLVSDQQVINAHIDSEDQTDDK